MNAFLGLLKSKEMLSYELEEFVRKVAERGSGSKKKMKISMMDKGSCTSSYSAKKNKE